MTHIAAFAPVDRTLWLLFVFVIYLRLRGISWHDAIMFPLGGVVWAWVVAAVAAVPLSLSSKFGSFEPAWLWLTPWLILAVVPIYTWRRVPGALLPRVKLSELIFWNVTVISISFGGWIAGGGRDASWLANAAVAVLALAWLWPSVVALILRAVENKVLRFLVRLPLLFYIWISIAFWLVLALLDQEVSEAFVMFRIAVSLWASFAAIEIFAVLYLFCFIFVEEGGADVETNKRVSEAFDAAIEIDEWNWFTVVTLGALTGALVTIFVWANASWGWGVPVYCLLALPRTISEVMNASDSAPPVMRSARGETS